MIINIKEWKVGDTFILGTTYYCIVIEIWGNTIRFKFSDNQYPANKSWEPYGRMFAESIYNMRRISYEEFIEYEQRVANDV